MAVGRPTMDPSWDDAGAAGATPNDQNSSSNSQTPPPATPADAATPEEAQAIEAARSALQEQPTHDQLQPMEPLSGGAQPAAAPIASPQPTPSAPQDNTPAPVATTAQADSNQPVPATGPAPVGSATAEVTSSVSPASQVSTPSTSVSELPTTNYQLPTPSTTPPQLSSSVPAQPSQPTADTLAQSLDQPTESPAAAPQSSGTNLNQPPVPRIPREQSTPPLPAASHRLPGYAVALIGLVVVAVLAAGVYLGSEVGYLALGVERLWGISNNPEQALASAGAALGDASSYAVDGELSVALGGEGDATARTVATQFRQEISSSLSQLDSSWTVGADVPGSVLGSRLNEGGTVRFVAQTDGQTLYVRLNEGDTSIPWTKTDIGELAAFQLQPLRWQDFTATIGQATGGKRLGGKSINGVKSKGYQFEVPLGTLLSSISPELVSLQDLVTVEVWLESKQGLPQLITVSSGSQSSSSVTGQLVFRDYGVSTDIVLPTESEATAGTIRDWLEVNGIVGVQSGEARDATRRSDLDKIKQALEEYAAAQTPLAYPVTTGIVRLDQDQTLKDALTPYLADIPQDPQAPDRYYGYQSDGQTYTLTAVAEEASGDDITDINGLKLITRANK